MNWLDNAKLLHISFSRMLKQAMASTEHNVAVRSRLRRFLDVDLHTEKGRRRQMMTIIVAALCPGCMLIIQNAILVTNHLSLLNKKADVKANIFFSLEIGLVVHHTQIERGTSSLFVSSGGELSTIPRLYGNRQDTDRAIEKLSRWISKPNSSGIFQGAMEMFASRVNFHEKLKDFRMKIDNLTVSTREVVQFYTDINAVLVEWVLQSVKDDKSVESWADLVAYQMLTLSKENTGVERAIGVSYFGGGGYSEEERLWYFERRVLGRSYLDRCLGYSNIANDILNNQFRGTPLETRLRAMREEILSNELTEEAVDSGVVWLDTITAYINILKEIQDAMANDIIQSTETEMETLRSNLNSSIAVMVCTVLFNLILMPIVLILVLKMTNRIHKVAQDLKEKTSDLELERKRSEKLLYQMLPVPVARKLMAAEHVTPECFGSVTIMFSDIVGFTSICGKCTPLQVVDMLNILYVTFDNRLEMYDVYKVETIGDAYMVASGLPTRNGDKHVVEIAHLSVDLLRSISNLVIPQVRPERLKLRIGINTGSVVAGVVGHKMPKYCVFGDTVNMASRMESTGEPHRIQCTLSTYTALIKYTEFRFEERDSVYVKGKGNMKTFWLLGKDADCVMSPRSAKYTTNICNGESRL